MRIEYSLPFESCKGCSFFVMSVKRQTYLNPLNTENVIKVTCKHQRECINKAIRLKRLESKEHEK